MMKNGQRSKRRARNGTSKKQRGAVAKMEDILFAADSQQPEPSSSSSKKVTAAVKLSLKHLLATLNENETDSDFDAEAIAEFKESNTQDRFTRIASTGLKDETKEDLMKKYSNNVIPMLKAPILNPEIAELLPEELINFDNQVVERQNQTGVAVAAIMEALNGIRTKKKRSDIIKMINDAAMLLADTQYTSAQQQGEVQRLLANLGNE